MSLSIAHARGKGGSFQTVSNKHKVWSFVLVWNLLLFTLALVSRAAILSRCAMLLCVTTQKTAMWGTTLLSIILLWFQVVIFIHVTNWGIGQFVSNFTSHIFSKINLYSAVTSFKNTRIPQVPWLLPSEGNTITGHFSVTTCSRLLFLTRLMDTLYSTYPHFVQLLQKACFSTHTGYIYS